MEIPESPVYPHSRSLAKSSEMPAQDSQPKLCSMDDGTKVGQSLPICFAVPKTCPKGIWLPIHRSLIEIIIMPQILVILTLKGFFLLFFGGDI